MAVSSERFAYRELAHSSVENEIREIQKNAHTLFIL